MYLSKEDFWRIRVERTKQAASLYDLLTEEGEEPRTRDRDAQMHCVFKGSHQKGKDTKPSARYYPAHSRNDEFETFYCFYCTDRPLDAIGFVMRAKGLDFKDALRWLERRYGVRYDDIEVAPDISKELKEITKQKKAVDPSTLFRYCELTLKENRDRIGFDRFVRLSYALDVIYFRDDENRPEDTVARLEKWKAAVKKLLNGDSNGGTEGPRLPDNPPGP